MTMADLKAKVSIEWYCEHILNLTFADYKTKCPFHDGTSETTFVISRRNASSLASEVVRQ